MKILNKEFVKNKKGEEVPIYTIKTSYTFLTLMAVSAFGNYAYSKILLSEQPEGSKALWKELIGEAEKHVGEPKFDLGVIKSEDPMDPSNILVKKTYMDALNVMYVSLFGRSFESDETDADLF